MDKMQHIYVFLFEVPAILAIFNTNDKHVILLVIT